jgi:hypothetical protein
MTLDFYRKRHEFRGRNSPVDLMRQGNILQLQISAAFQDGEAPARKSELSGDQSEDVAHEVQPP